MAAALAPGPRGRVAGAAAAAPAGRGTTLPRPERAEPSRPTRNALLSAAGTAAAAVALRSAQGRRGGWPHGRCRSARTRRRFFEGLNLGPLFEDPSEQTRRRFSQQVEEINAWEASLEPKTDMELRAAADALRKRARGGEEAASLLPEAFALVREASRRVLGLRHFDVQLVGGAVLHEGGVAEMATGEGKTLAAILPAFLNSLGGSGVHIVTTNDYLARRDAEWVGQPLRFLGTSVGVVQSEMASAQRQRAYACDVTYVTNSELGFDYLRDQLATCPAELVMRSDDPFHYAIVDEVDSVLIDEARTPLVISAPATKPSEKYAAAQDLAGMLRGPLHYTLEEKERRVALTAEGVEEAERLLGKGDLFDPEDPWAPFVVNALNAKEFFSRDKQYIVRDGRVVIVDEFTGRPMAGRRWSSGLHQAVEAKEGVEIEAEAITQASISYQSLFRLFGRLSGMTGTAATEAKEFEKIYDLQVSVVPTNRPCQRDDDEDQVYISDKAKWNAVVREIEATHRTGRPVLVGTTNVENSELIAARLAELKVPCRLLNAKPENAAREAEIIAAGGRKGAVTIATNMAGRGTDVILGGSSGAMARLRLREELYPLLFPQRMDEWVMPEDFYPTQLSEATQDLVRTAAKEAALCGELSELRAGELLACACEARASSSGSAGERQDEAKAEAALRHAYRELEREFGAVVKAERKEVLDLGGLYVIGTERHESRRIDNQLRGRAGRQGDPGLARFYLSLTDNVFRVFGGDAIEAVAGFGGPDDVDVPLGSPFLSGALDEAQKQVESYFYGIRKDVFKYDQIMDKQRRVLYSLRRRALLDSDEGLEASMRDFNTENMEEYVAQQVDAEQPLEKWPFEEMARKTSKWFMGCLNVQPEQLREAAAGGGEQGAAAVRAWLTREGQQAIARKEALIERYGPGLQHAVRRQIMLLQVDTFWQRHLRNMEFLRNSAKLRAYGNQDPLVEYKRDGYGAFLGMMGRIRRNSIFQLFNFEPRSLTPVTDERLGELASQAPTFDHCDEAALSHLRTEVRERLGAEGAEAYDGKVLVPLSELAGALAEAGAATQGEQLRWAAAGEGLELLEDNLAKAYYIAVKDPA